MKNLFEARFYIHCPDCRQRMRRIITEGHDIYSTELGYEVSVRRRSVGIR